MKKIILVLAILAIFGGGLFWYTHRSVEKEKSTEDLKILEILERENNEEIFDEKKYEQKEIVFDEKKSEKVLEKTEENIEENSEIEEIKILKSGSFNPEAKGSDAIHRGWGDLKIINAMGKNRLVFEKNFKVTNGPDYKIYFSENKNIEDEKSFLAVKKDAIKISNLRQFSGSQIFEISDDVDIEKINSVVIWCEAFSEFISVANLK